MGGSGVERGGVGRSRLAPALWIAAALGCTDPGVVGTLCPDGHCPEHSEPSLADACVGSACPADAAASADAPLPPAADGGKLEPRCDPTSTRQRLDIFLVLDDAASSLPWWLEMRDALQLFVDDAASSGIGLAMQLNRDSCEVESYIQPRVPLAALPDNRDAIVAALPAVPTGDGATATMLSGTIIEARAWSTRHPESEVIVLLLSDGLSDDCDSSLENIAAAARDGTQGQPPVRSYAVVIGGLGFLDAFAQLSGMSESKLVPPGSASALFDALTSVRDRTVPCVDRR